MRTLLHNRKRELSIRDSRYCVIPTVATERVEPRTVVLCIDPSGPMRLQDHLTPEEADALADALHAVAAEVRQLNSHRGELAPQPVGIAR